jgi:hypothetical protein
MDSSGIFPASISAVLKSKDTFATLLFECPRFKENGVCDAKSRNSHRCDQWRQWAQRGGDKCGRESTWVCGQVAMPGNSLPDLAAIQSAYEREASAASTLHDNGLQVLQAKMS